MDFLASATFLWMDAGFSALPWHRQVHAPLQVHELALVMLHIQVWPVLLGSSEGLLETGSLYVLTILELTAETRLS